MKNLFNEHNIQAIISFIGDCLFGRPDANKCSLVFESIERQPLFRLPALHTLEFLQSLQKEISEQSNNIALLFQKLIEQSRSFDFSKKGELLKFIRSHKDLTNCFPALEEILERISDDSDNDNSDDRSDIRIVIHNLYAGTKSKVDKIIASKLGGDSTLLNASGDNTNFVFEITGPMDDEKMNKYNSIFKQVKRKGETCYDVATTDRMQYLHEIGCDINFVDTAKSISKINLIKCGGMEMPGIVAGMLKKFYFENLGGTTSVQDCIEYLAENDVVGYGFDDLKETYHGKIAHLLLCTFTGMRLGSPWNGRQAVNGGYIVVKNNGDVVAFHSTIADEFKDFLVAKMIMEGPSHSRHKDMVIYKEGDRYFLKLALQLRFSLNR